MTDHLIQSENDLLLTHFIRHQANKYRTCAALLLGFFRGLNAALASAFLQQDPNWIAFK